MQLIVLTADTSVPDEAAILNELLANGLQRLHLRKPGMDVNGYQQLITAIDGQFHNRLVLCEHFYLSADYNVGGVHINSYQRKDPGVMKAIAEAPLSRVSTSFHSWAEVMGNGIAYGYVFISPVFNSISKAGYNAAIPLDDLINVRDYCKARLGYCPAIVGLGGVRAEQAALLQLKGFDGAALLGSIWQHGDPVQNFRQVKAAISEG